MIIVTLDITPDFAVEKIRGVSAGNMTFRAFGVLQIE